MTDSVTDLPDDVGPEEEVALLAVARRLTDERPLPSARFRGELGRRIVGQTSRWRPRRPWKAAVAFACAGTLCLGAASVNLVGRGPVAAPQAHVPSVRWSAYAVIVPRAAEPRPIAASYAPMRPR